MEKYCPLKIESRIMIAVDNNNDWCPFITCTRKFRVPDQLLTTVKPRLICNYLSYPYVLSRKLELKYTLFFYKNAYNFAEPEDVLMLAHTFS